jgi:hypothetical protein
VRLTSFQCCPFLFESLELRAREPFISSTLCSQAISLKIREAHTKSLAGKHLQGDLIAAITMASVSWSGPQANSLRDSRFYCTKSVAVLYSNGIIISFKFGTCTCNQRTVFVRFQPGKHCYPHFCSVFVTRVETWDCQDSNSFNDSQICSANRSADYICNSRILSTVSGSIPPNSVPYMNGFFEAFYPVPSFRAKNS